MVNLKILHFYFDLSKALIFNIKLIQFWIESLKAF